MPSVKLNIERLIDYIDQEESYGLSLPRLSWTTTARRAHRLFRVGVTRTTIAEINQKLQEALTRGDGTTRAKNKPKMLFTFTGQGSQFLGMGTALFDVFPILHPICSSSISWLGLWVSPRSSPFS